MDVHRARFVPYPTSPITALAFSRSSDSGYADGGLLPALRLAIGRANGDIEIWNPLRGAWAHESTLLGDGRSIDGLAWTQDPEQKAENGDIVPGQQRLFSIAASPAVTEWDLETGTVKKTSSGNFSEVWCFAAQPRWRASKNTSEEARAQDIVAGCEDGTIVLLSTADEDLQFKRFLARVAGKKSRCMCIAYQNRDAVVAGFADSVLRVYDTRSGSQIRQMSLGASVPGAPKSAIIWQIRALANGDLLSCDSNGELRFWDGRNYSLQQRITGHDCDCLDITASADGKTVFSSSLDGKIAVYKQTTTDSGRRSWGKIGQRRVHHGEAKMLASFDSKAGLSVVVSGGRDVAPVLTPLREYGKENQRALPSLPQEAKVVSAPKARLIVSWWENEIHIWRIERPLVTPKPPKRPRPHRLIARLSIDTARPIRSISISADGKVLVVSTSDAIKAFQFRWRPSQHGLAVRKVVLPEDLECLGARLLSVSPNGKWLAAATPRNEVHIARFAEDVQDPKRIVCLPQVGELNRQQRKVQLSAYKDYDRSISKLVFSQDSAALVAGDITGNIDSWILQGTEDFKAPATDTATRDLTRHSSDDAEDDVSITDQDHTDDYLPRFYGQHWLSNPPSHLLPRLDSAPLILTFRPTPPSFSQNPSSVSLTSTAEEAKSYYLLALTSRHSLHEFDLLSGRLSAWSRRNPTAALPDEFRQIKDRVIGHVWDAKGSRERLWLWGSSWVGMLNVGSDFSDAGEEAVVMGLQGRRKRKAKAGEDGEREKKKAKAKGRSGAGDAVDEEFAAFGGDAVKRVDAEKNVEQRSTATTGAEVGLHEEPTELPVAKLRSRAIGGDNEEERENGDAFEAGKDAEKEEQRKWWCTFKYRPILGMVSLSSDDDTHTNDDERADSALEVVVVERPAQASDS